MFKKAWETQSTERYSDFLYKMRSTRKKQRYVSDEIWASWQQAWSDLKYQRKWEITSHNRLSEMGGEGTGPSRHTGSSISAIEIIEKSNLNRQPTPMEVFTFTHTKNHDGVTFIDRRAKLVRDNYTTGKERVIASHAQTGEHPTIDQLQPYLEAAGGKKKRKMYRIGSQSDIFYSRMHGFNE
ncbi:hypothetical protein JCGZ_18515 [Jatropha curcas]|uniref:Uncharacterized protein n=1 Tax=Jatropha curcas TaxID=180498 RepID=A0A067K139_JATCU|nr:hypothetical protein JCGZ_18515 [Jatropha curcas]